MREHRDLDAIVELLDGAGDQVVWKPDREPAAHALSLMATLGVRVEWPPVTAVSAHELVATRDCVYPHCPEEAEPGAHHCRRHLNYERDIASDRKSPSIAANGSVEPRTETVRMDTKSSGKWNRASIIEAFHRFHAEHGRWPLRSDSVGNDDLPGERPLARLGIKWQDIWYEVEAGPLPNGRAAANYKTSALRPQAKRPATTTSGRGPVKPRTTVEPEPSPVPVEAEPELWQEPEPSVGTAERVPRPEPSEAPPVGISPLIDRLIGQRAELLAEASRLNDLSVEAAAKRDAIYQLINQLEELSR